MSSLSPLPSGWGWPGGTVLGAPPPQLPDLPLLSVINAGRVTTVIRDAVLSVPGLLTTLTCRHLMDKYGISRSIAYDVLRFAEPRRELA